MFMLQPRALAHVKHSTPIARGRAGPFRGPGGRSAGGRCLPVLGTLVLCTMGFVVGSSAGAAEVSYDLGFYSHYVWRGLTVTDGPVFQPTLGVAHDSGFSIAVWGNLELDDANDRSGDFSEIDVTASYGWGSDAIDYEIGLIAYEFPNAFGPSTREGYFKVALQTALEPTIAVYYDFDEIEDFYATFGLSHTFGLADPWSVTLSALAAYAGDSFAALSGGTESGFHDGNLSVSLDYEKGAFSWGLLAAYTDSLDEQVLTPQATDFWGGIYFGFSR